MENLTRISLVNIKYHLSPSILLSLLMLFISPLIMGVKNLNPSESAQVLEFYAVLTGILLLVPLYIPDQDQNIRALILSKKVSYGFHLTLRFLNSIIMLNILILLYLCILQLGNCDFPFGRYYFGTLAGALFIGGIGILAFSLFDNLAGAYMLPILYYSLNFGSGKKLLGNFYLFSMGSGSITEKWYLFFGGIVLILLGVNIRTSILKKKGAGC